MVGPVLGAIMAAVAASVDGFTVGSAYGLRGIRIPFLSLALIGFVSSALAAAAMAGGRWLAALAPALAARAGSVILLALGAAWIVEAWRRQHRRGAAGPGAFLPEGPAAAAVPKGPAEALRNPATPVLLLRFRMLGLVVQVWSDPGAADLDRSGRLEALESLILGVSLALDGSAVAMAASLGGWAPLFPLFVGPVQALALRAGVAAGRLGRRWRGAGLASYVPGCILLALGLARLV